MKSLILLKIGGFIHFCFAISHIFFPTMFNWNTMLGKLPELEAAILGIHLSILNYNSFLFLVIFAIIPIFFSKDLIDTKLGKAVLTSIVMFWIIRIFIIQPVFAGFNIVSIKIAVFFLVALIMFLIPWIKFVIMKKKL